MHSRLLSFQDQAENHLLIVPSHCEFRFPLLLLSDTESITLSIVPDNSLIFSGAVPPYIINAPEFLYDE